MFRIVLSLMKIIMRRYTVYGIENITEGKGAIYVCNHDGSYGPLAMGLFFPYRFRPWVLHHAMTAGLCRRQLELDLFGDCKAVLKPFCRLASLIIEPACLWVMRKTRAIPVYRGGSGIFTTFRQSMEALVEGYNIVLFPERDELEYRRHLKDFYTGFVHLARKFYDENGKILSFYPVYIDKGKRKITVGKPVVYNPEAQFKNERERMANILMEAIRECTGSNK
jgi:1-acyl-sn-glycerol-3-phosphate acyltransferase